MTGPLLARSYFGQDYELEAVTTLAAAARDHWKLPFGAGAMELAAVMRVALGERDVDLSEITAAIQGEAHTFSLMTASELRGWNETEVNRLVAKAEAVAFKKSWAPHIAR